MSSTFYSDANLFAVCEKCGKPAYCIDHCMEHIFYNCTNDPDWKRPQVKGCRCALCRGPKTSESGVSCAGSTEYGKLPATPEDKAKLESRLAALTLPRRKDV